MCTILRRYDRDEIHVLTADGAASSKTINFDQRTSVLTGDPPIRHLYGVRIEVLVGAIHVIAAFPGRTFSFEINADDEPMQRYWLLNPIPITANSSVTFNNIATDQPEASSSSNPGIESQFKFVIIGLPDEGSAPDPTVP